MKDKIKQAVADEFKYRASQGRTNYSMEEVIYIVSEVIDETDCSGESKTTSTTEVNLDCWQNEPTLLTSNPPKLLWKCRFCGKEITTEVSEIPTTPCNCLKETKVMSQAQFTDVDMEMRIIKGDLQYLSEKVDKLSSLLEQHINKEVS